MNIKKYKLLLNNPRLLLLWIGSFISGIGDAIAVVVIIWTIYNQTHNPLLITLALLCLELPSILFGPAIGVYIDRSPKALIVSANLIRGGLFIYLLFIPLNSIGNYTLFLILLSISSALAPITKAGENMIIPEIVDKDDLVLANSLMYIQFDLALVIGPLIGGLLAAEGKILLAFLVNAVTFIVAAVFFFYIFPKAKRHAKSVKRSIHETFNSWWFDFKEGLVYIFNEKGITALVWTSFLWNLLIWGTAPTLIPIYNEVNLLSDARGYGMLGAATSLGIVLGSIIIGSIKMNKNLFQLVMVSIVSHGILYACLAFTHNLLVAAVLFLLSGVISAPAMIYMRTLIQQVVPKEKLGRIFTVLSAMGAFGFPIGTILASSLVAYSGEDFVSYAFLLFGGLLSFLVLILSFKMDKRAKEVADGQQSI